MPSVSSITVSFPLSVPNFDSKRAKETSRLPELLGVYLVKLIV